MITSFFRTSKPIHYIIFIIVLILVFLYQRIIVGDFGVKFLNSLEEMGYLLIVLTSFFLLIFIVTKNNLTHNNSYAELYFCLFVGLIPSSLEINSILISNLFILLSLRRIVSLKTKTNIKKKLLDASMWICLAAVFEPWAILFLALIFMAMVLYSVSQIKNMVIPFCGILIVGILMTCLRLLTDNVFPNFFKYIPEINFDRPSFSDQYLLEAPIQFIIFILFGIVVFLAKGLKKNRLNRPSFIVLILAIFIGVSIVFLSPSNETGYYLFTFIPTAILLANFSETTKFRWFSELMIGLLLLAVIFQIGWNIYSRIH